MAGFQRRGFKTELYSAIMKEANGRFNALLCRPQWLNAVDFAKLSEASGVPPVPRNLEGIEGLPAFLKFLGARDATISDLSSGLASVAPSIVGAAEIVAHLTNLHSIKQIRSHAINPAWKLWPVADIPVSLNEAKIAAKPLGNSFLDIFMEKSGNAIELSRLIEVLDGKSTAAILVPNRPAPASLTFHADSTSTESSQRISLKRWRGAEQQVFTLLKAWGWKIEDVSRQNLGYDFEGITQEGKEVFIEIKSLDYPGQPFSLTSNEEAVARQKCGNYRLAIVRQTNTHLELAFIHDPANQLRLTRQCRQWVWECSQYEFVPERFNLE